jgi:hypothetical protein
MPTGMAMYGTGSLPLAMKAINVIAIIVVIVFIWISFFVGDLTRIRLHFAVYFEMSP